MTFEDLKSTLAEKLGTSKLADIAKEFDVTPQVVSNWKARNQVPYKYVQLLRLKIGQLNKQENYSSLPSSNFGQTGNIYEGSYDKLEGESFDMLELMKNLVSKIVANRKTFFSIPALFTIFTAIHVQYYVEPVYTTNLKFLPVSSQSSSGMSQVSSVAATFGFDLGASGSSSLSSAEMFPEIIKSRTLVKKLLGEKFYSSTFKDTLTLSAILGGGKTSDKQDSLRKLNVLASSVSSSIQIHKPRGSEIQTLVVKSKEPKLAVSIALRIIDFVNELQRKFQNNNIKEKKIFINNRASDVTTNLEKAEEKLKNFRESNRAIISSPALMLEQTRLVREVELQTELYITLKSQLELVKIEESGRMNSVEILDYPEIPFLKSSPNKKFRVAMGFFLSLIFTISFISIKDSLVTLIKKVISEVFN